MLTITVTWRFPAECADGYRLWCWVGDGCKTSPFVVRTLQMWAFKLFTIVCMCQIELAFFTPIKFFFNTFQRLIYLLKAKYFTDWHLVSKFVGFHNSIFLIQQNTFFSCLCVGSRNTWSENKRCRYLRNCILYSWFAQHICASALILWI